MSETVISRKTFRTFKDKLEIALHVSKEYQTEDHQVVFERVEDEFTVYYEDSTKNKVRVENIPTRKDIENYLQSIVDKNNLKSDEYNVIFDKYDVIRGR